MPNVLTNHNSLSTSYRLAWGLWIGCTAIYLVAYLFVADLRGDGAHGLLLASTLVLQAILVPACIWRAKFASRLEAAIRGAAGGVAFSGLTVTLFLFTEKLFHTPRSLTDSENLQLGFVSTILLLGGLAGGIQLAVLRWNILQQVATPVNDAPADSAWRRYLRSAVSWIASVTVFCWLPNAYHWSAASSSVAILVPAGISLGIAGLFLIAPIPAIFPATPSASRGQRVWRYSGLSLLVLLSIWTLATVASLAHQSLLAVYLIGSLPSFLLLWMPCVLWAMMYGLAEQPITQKTESSTLQAAFTSPRPTSISSWKLLTLSLVTQACALLAALLATAPVSLGLQGVGCLHYYSANAAEYWFWQAYKGIGRRSESADRMIFRPAVDSGACVVINQKEMASLQDPKQLTLGYTEAARSWYWLIDPDEWESTRTKEIRQELVRLLGRDFSSYAELREWWALNNEHLFWSGTDERLEVREPGVQDLANPYAYHLKHPMTPVSAVEYIRQQPHALDPESETGKITDGNLRAVLLDREVRLRGLKLAAGDWIEVLTGKRARIAKEFLERVIGKQYATKVEWLNFLGQGIPPVPWRMSRASAQEWVAVIQLYGGTEPYRQHDVEELREQTGLNYSTPEEFIPWLQNTENTRQEEWQKARELANDLYDDRNPHAGDSFAMGWLKSITDQSFDSAQEWVQWWQDNHANLTLSADGRKLVTGRR